MHISYLFTNISTYMSVGDNNVFPYTYLLRIQRIKLSVYPDVSLLDIVYLC